jgi:hypothetical protein
MPLALDFFIPSSIGSAAEVRKGPPDKGCGLWMLRSAPFNASACCAMERGAQNPPGKAQTKCVALVTGLSSDALTAAKIPARFYQLLPRRDFHIF